MKDISQEDPIENTVGKGGPIAVFHLNYHIGERRQPSLCRIQHFN